MLHTAIRKKSSVYDRIIYFINVIFKSKVYLPLDYFCHKPLDTHSWLIYEPHLSCSSADFGNIQAENGLKYYSPYNCNMIIVNWVIVVVVVVNHCFSSTFGTNGILSDIVIQ